MKPTSQTCNDDDDHSTRGRAGSFFFCRKKSSHTADQTGDVDDDGPCYEMQVNFLFENHPSSTMASMIIAVVVVIIKNI